jgi:hypothetical protein
VTQQAAPSLQILLLAFRNTQHAPQSLSANADLARPAALAYHPVKLQIRKLALDRALA